MGISNYKPISYQLLADDKHGNVFELPATRITWKTQRTGRAGSLEFEFLGGDKFCKAAVSLSCGDVVRLEAEGEVLFYGYVFSVEKSDGGTFSAVAYDQMRYLMVSDTYVFEGKTASQIVRRIAGDFNIRLGTIAETGYAIPKLSQDNKKLLDMMAEALSETTCNTGKTFVLYDKAGSLTLAPLENIRLAIALGDPGMTVGYDYKESIDDETYNRIKLIQENKKAGLRDVYVYQDGKTIAKWGVLQYYESVDSGYNAAMINQRGATLLALKNREQKTFKLDARGDVSCRAGAAVYVELSDLGIAQYYVIESADHSFEGNDYSMSLTMKVVD